MPSSSKGNDEVGGHKILDNDGNQSGHGHEEDAQANYADEEEEDGIPNSRIQNNRVVACDQQHDHDHDHDQDEDNCDDEEDEDDYCSDESSTTSTSSTMNQPDNTRVCDCCYCEVFGHGVSPVNPSSRYNEMRERLRLRLSKRRAERCERQNSEPQDGTCKDDNPNDKGGGTTTGIGGPAVASSSNTTGSNNVNNDNNKSIASIGHQTIDELLEYINGKSYRKDQDKSVGKRKDKSKNSNANSNSNTKRNNNNKSNSSNKVTNKDSDKHNNHHHGNQHNSSSADTTTSGTPTNNKRHQNNSSANQNSHHHHQQANNKNNSSIIPAKSISSSTAAPATPIANALKESNPRQSTSHPSTEKSRPAPNHRSNGNCRQAGYDRSNTNSISSKPENSYSCEPEFEATNERLVQLSLFCDDISSKSMSESTATDDVFMPRDIDLDDNELDEFERELEAFKRFCFDSVPLVKKERVRVQLKDTQFLQELTECLTNGSNTSNQMESRHKHEAGNNSRRFQTQLFHQKASRV